MFIDRPEFGSRTLLVHVSMGQDEGPRLEELRELALSAGLEPTATVTCRRDQPDPRFFVGSGKLEELIEQVKANAIQLTVFNHELTASQERNVEKRLGCRVMSRTELILVIFAQRARSHEGKLQVELAQIHHAAGRLVRGWTHLDRQRGGSGRGQGSSAGLGGAGEKQLEADQRLLDQRLKKIHQRLERVRHQRALNRRTRARAEVRSLSLVGYTNAGKSTLFNRLCDAEVYAADQLFATLDPTLRRLSLPRIGELVLADTVGFISDLPHTLVEAFKATLEEVRSADLLLQVVDASDPFREQHCAQVNAVLEEIGAGEVPQLMVYNKCDLLAAGSRMDRDEQGKPWRVWLSARTGEGLPLLQDALLELLAPRLMETTLRLGPAQGRLRSDLYANGAVIGESFSSDGRWELRIRIEAQQLRRLVGNEPVECDDPEWGGAAHDREARHDAG